MDRSIPRRDGIFGGLLTVAVIPVLVGLAGMSAEAGLAVMPGYNRATIMTAGVRAVGVIASWLGFHPDTGEAAPTDLSAARAGT